MQFQFLKEMPHREEDSLGFGHKEVVNTLYHMVHQQDQHLTIGLFGGWGTGKSSIVENLRTKLQREKLPLVLFDVWKHEGDSLRRTFLIELHQQLQSSAAFGSNKIDLDERITGAVNSSQEKQKINRKKLTNTLLIFFCFFFAAAVMFGSIKLTLTAFDIHVFREINLAQIFTLGTLGVILSLLIKFGDTFIKAEKTETKKEKFQDPHEFESEFNKIIGGIEKDKVIITFDNLDRVNGDSALKIISTIKTFLSPQENGHTKKIFFLIPCDVESMKQHILATNGNANKREESLYLDEFMRKFFSTTLWIPDFHVSELEQFANEKLKETKVPEFDDPHLSWMILKVFHRNPRQIIQFINLLLSHYLLMAEFCEQGKSLASDFHKQNLPQLAKFLLLKQRHGDELQKYKLSGTYELEDETILREIEDADFHNLLRLTADIRISSLEPFFKYKANAEELAHPELAKLVELMFFDDEQLSAYEKELKSADSTFQLDNIVRQRLSVTKNPIAKSGFVGKLLEFSHRRSHIFSKGLYRELIDYLKKWDSNIYANVSTAFIVVLLFGKQYQLSIGEKQQILRSFLRYLYDNIELEKGKTHRYPKNYLVMFEYISHQHQRLLLPHEIKIFTEFLIQHPFSFELDCFMETKELQSIFFTENLRNIFSKELAMNPSKITRKCTVSAKTILKLAEKPENCGELLMYYKERWPILSTIEEEPNEQQQLALETLKDLFTFVSGFDKEHFSDELNSHLIDLYEKMETSIETRQYRFTNVLLAMSGVKHLHRAYNKIFISILNYWGREPALEYVVQLTELESWIGYDADTEDLWIQLLVRNNRPDLLGEDPDQSRLTSYMREAVAFGLYNQAEAFWIAHRDQVDTEHLSQLLLQLNQMLGNLRDTEETTQELLTLGKLILFVAEHDRQQLEGIGYWLNIAAALTNSSNQTRQEAAYDMIRNNIHLINRSAAMALMDQLITEIIDKRLYNTYLPNQLLIQLAGLYPNEETANSYAHFCIRHLMGNVSQPNIIEACVDHLRDTEEMIDFTPVQRDLRRAAQQLSMPELYQQQTVLRPLIQWLSDLDHKNRIGIDIPQLRLLRRNLEID